MVTASHDDRQQLSLRDLTQCNSCASVCKQQNRDRFAQIVATSSDGVLEDMSLASRTISIVLGLVGYVLGLVDKVLEFTKV